MEWGSTSAAVPPIPVTGSGNMEVRKEGHSLVHEGDIMPVRGTRKTEVRTTQYNDVRTSMNDKVRLFRTFYSQKFGIYDGMA